MVETGGKGGDVYFTVDPDNNTLINFKYNRKYAAENGQNGSGSNKYGKSGEDLYIKVPLGTVIKDAETGKLIADLSEVGQTELVLLRRQRRKRKRTFCYLNKTGSKICSRWRKRN